MSVQANGGDHWLVGLVGWLTGRLVGWLDPSVGRLAYPSVAHVFG